MVKTQKYLDFILLRSKVIGARIMGSRKLKEEPEG